MNNERTESIANFDVTDTHDVGDVRLLDGHEIELHDPPARAGLVWNCHLCGMWRMNPTLFESESCDEESKKA